MKIILALSISIISILFFGKRFFYSAKRNLFRDQSAWSGKDIKIKYSNSKESSESKRAKSNNNFLNIIANESQNYLEDPPIKEEE